jgi:hypothetical protein
LCLPHEVPRLTPVPPAIDATCEEIEPLAVVIERQRKRADQMMREDPQFLALRSSGHLLKGNGNGDDDTGS